MKTNHRIKRQGGGTVIREHKFAEFSVLRQSGQDGSTVTDRRSKKQAYYDGLPKVI